jgi:hypothetical protein
MSRYTLELGGNNVAFVVGWDNPLQTFFAQTFENYGQPDEQITWETGQIYEEHSNPDSFVKYLEEKGFDVPYVICSSLYLDYAGRHGLTPHQQNVRKMMDELKAQFK